MSSIDNLKSTISKKGGLAPVNRFNVIFTPPGGVMAALLSKDPKTLVGSLNLESAAGALLSGGFDPRNLIPDPRDITYLCESVNIPSRSISTFDHGSHVQTNKYPYTFIDEDVTMSFLLTNDYYMKNMMDKWLSCIFDTDKYQAGYKSDYTTDIIIQQLNQELVPVYGVKLRKAYPILVAAIGLDNGGSGYQKMSVTFAYDKFITEGPLSSTGSAIRAALPF
jgi:hypothetical protein